MFRSLKNATILIGSGVVLLGLMSGRAIGGDNLRLELAQMAQEMAEFLRQDENKPISVGQFTCKQPQYGASGGLSITKILCEELGKAKVKVELLSPYGVKGEFEAVNDKKSGNVAARIYAEVVDNSGTVVAEYERVVFGEGVITSLFGGTIDLPPKADSKTRSEKLGDSLEPAQRNVYIDQNTVYASEGSPYGVEIYVKSAPEEEYRVQTPTLQKSLAFVPISREQIYAVKLINNSEYDCAVLLTIDGLNMFTFSEEKLGGFVVVRAGRDGFIKGWYRTKDLSDSFQVVEYSKSAAAQQLKSPVNIGTITATFSAAWEKGTTPPPDEPLDPSKYSRSGDATGRGPEVEAKYTLVQRDVGVIRSTVSVRYQK